jgi:predicted benzoate:H+ symporter BenE
MNKPVFGMLLGGFLGIFDGLSALVSAPETAPQIVGIVIGSTVKGIVTGLLIGLFTRKSGSLPLALVFGLGVGCFLAFLITIGSPYSWQIMLPGSILGLVVGYATFRHRAPAEPAPAR